MCGRLVSGALATAVVMLGASGCTDSSHSMCVVVNPAGWRADDEACMVYDNTDTLSFRELSVYSVWTAGNERREPLVLDVAIMTPDSLWFEQQVEVPSVAGGGIGEQTFRAHALLGRTGEYRFVVKHAGPSAVDELRAVGIEITCTEDGKR